jgi:hypothetical protein
MSTANDWLPHNHEALYDQAKQTWTYFTVGDNRYRMGFYNTPPTKWEELIHSNFDTCSLHPVVRKRPAEKSRLLRPEMGKHPGRKRPLERDCLCNHPVKAVEVFDMLLHAF